MASVSSREPLSSRQKGSREAGVEVGVGAEAGAEGEGGAGAVTGGGAGEDFPTTWGAAEDKNGNFEDFPQF